MKKPIIAVDVDDVLADCAEEFVAFSNRRWGTALTVEDIDEDWGKMWQVDHAETIKRAEDFHSSGTVSNYPVFADAAEVLARLKTQFRLVVLTSRNGNISAETRAWIDEKYGDVFEHVYFSGIYDNFHKNADAHRLTKADRLLEIGADYLIDDQPKHCTGATDVGVQAILFGEYPWSRVEGLSPAITRCKNWQEIADYFGV